MARLTPQYEVIPQPARRMARDAGTTIREQRVFCLKSGENTSSRAKSRCSRLTVGWVRRRVKGMTTAQIKFLETDPSMISAETTLRAAASDVYALIADPARHAELDGGGSVRGLVSGDTPELREGDTKNVPGHPIPHVSHSRARREKPGPLLAHARRPLLDLGDRR